MPESQTGTGTAPSTLPVNRTSLAFLGQWGQQARLGRALSFHCHLQECVHERSSPNISKGLTMDGYQFVKAVLGLTGNAVRPLITLAGDSEPEWLEFKAATRPEDGVLEKGRNEWDYRWDVSRALFAMANGIGGALLLGVREKPLQPVSLECSGYKDDRDNFTRRLIQEVIKPKAGWRTVKCTWNADEPDHDLFSPEWGHFDGAPVVIIFVQPRSNADGWIEVTQRHNNQISNVVLRRVKGDVGKIEEVPSSRKLQAWWDNRDIERQSAKFESLLASISRKSEDTVNRAIQNYINGLVEEFSDLSELFTSLNAKELRNEIPQKKKNRTRGFVDDEDWLPSSDSLVSGADQSKSGDPILCETTRLRYGDAIELLNQEPRAVLLGEPGAGKSTSMCRIALERATSWQPGKLWPLLVSLAEYSEVGLRPLLLRRLPGLEWIDIEERIRDGEVVILLDALNECPSSRYLACSQDLHSLITDYPLVNVVISSRATHNPSALGLPTFELLPLQVDQQRQLLAVYLLDTQKDPQNVLERLYHHPGAVMIAQSPIMLRLVAWICRDDEELPLGLAKLYQQFLYSWYRRETQKDRENGTPTLVTFPRLRDSLALLAYRMRAHGLVSCSLDFARKALTRIVSPEEADYLITRYAQGLLLKVNRTDEMLQFYHETVQEYLVAEFLVAHVEDELVVVTDSRSIGRWTMPLVFAFELADSPSEAFLHSAWSAEPLLVCAAMRDGQRLSTLPLNRSLSPWLRGVLRTLRGEDAKEDTEEIVYIARFPPKYELPEELINTLRGMPFWYAIQTHEDGERRVARLRELTQHRRDIWVELLPTICARQTHWIEGLYPPQRLLVEDDCSEDLAAVLDEATVSELCILYRNRKISKQSLRERWKNALRKSTGEQLKMDLIMLLRTNEIKVSQFNGPLQECLREIGEHRDLSPRLLNVLLREKVISKSTLLSQPSRIDQLFDRMSPLNAERFVKNGIIGRNDMTPTRVKKLVLRIKSSSDENSLLTSGLVTLEEINSIRQKLPEDKPSNGKLTDESVDALINHATQTDEQRTLSAILEQLRRPENQSPGSGYHRVLLQELENAMNWPEAERNVLADQAAVFFKKNGSKNKMKQYKAIIRRLRRVEGD